jgi:hypothetical protein
MPRHSCHCRVKCDHSSRFALATSQQQIGGSRTPVLRLGRRDREDVPSQLRFLQPAWNRTLEDAKPALAKSPPGDHEHATPSRRARRGDEGGKCRMRLGLCQSVKIEACLDPVQTALQSLSVGAVDPGKTIERRHVRGGRAASLNSRRSGIRLAARPFRSGRPSAAQPPNVANRLLPKSVITSRARDVPGSLHLSPPHRPRRERYGDAWARAHPVRCAARYPPCATDR